MQKYLHEHFLSEGHKGLLNDVEIAFADKMEPSDSIRRDQFWTPMFKTLTSDSLHFKG